jgi:hypothetical protein
MNASNENPVIPTGLGYTQLYTLCLEPSGNYCIDSQCGRFVTRELLGTRILHMGALVHGSNLTMRPSDPILFLWLN